MHMHNLISHSELEKIFSGPGQSILSAFDNYKAGQITHLITTSPYNPVMVLAAFLATATDEACSGHHKTNPQGRLFFIVDHIN